MAVKIGINGFGRIGRMVFQAREAELIAGSLQAAPADVGKQSLYATGSGDR